MDKEIFKFTVLWEGWECDPDGWVMERPDGTRYLRLTNLGREYEAEPEALHQRIAEYQIVLAQSLMALELLSPQEKPQAAKNSDTTKDQVCERAARDWLTAHPQADPQYSTALGMLFNDNRDADELETAITEEAEAEGFSVEPDDIAKSVLKIKKP